MKRIALLTSLAMAAPVAAYASPPVRVADVQVYERDRDPSITVRWNHERYERFGRSRHAHDRGRWVSLGDGFSAANQRQFIAVNGVGRYRKLRIEGVRGEPVIAKVTIEFENGTQSVEFNERLPNGAGEVIDLNGDVRKINRIIVYTDPRSRGAYSVYGA
jgi:hypothetical protein